jgi:hypothetical protein
MVILWSTAPWSHIVCLWSCKPTVFPLNLFQLFSKQEIQQFEIESFVVLS